MSKHHRVWNASIYEKYVSEGRGCGSGADYSPWIRVQDFSSRGVISRVKGRTTGRVHHLMSNNELAYFYILDFSESVTDIREQYPLADLDRATTIAAQAGIKYPKDNASGYPYVMTCDFMITTKDGLRARTVKASSELSNPRILEKLEIERRYWQEKGIDWKIVTEQQISYCKAKNIEWLYSAYGYEVPNCTDWQTANARETMVSLLTGGTCGIYDATAYVEREFMLPFGAGLQLFKRLVLDRIITLDLSEPINLNELEVATA